jgi:hypothetical protein
MPDARLTGLDLAHADRGVDELPQQGVVESRHGVLGSAVDTSTSVCLSAGDGAEVDDSLRLVRTVRGVQNIRQSFAS